jgi:hypothetical protein
VECEIVTLLSVQVIKLYCYLMCVVACSKHYRTV